MAPDHQQSVVRRGWDLGPHARVPGHVPSRGQQSDSRGSLSLRCFLSWILTISSLLLPGTTVCPPCDNEMKSEAIVEHLCASEFGKGERWEHRDTSLGAPGSVAPVWAGSWTAVCPCPLSERCARCGSWCGRSAPGQPPSFPEARPACL